MKTLINGDRRGVSNGMTKVAAGHVLSLVLHRSINGYEVFMAVTRLLARTEFTYSQQLFPILC